eukprot:2890667-Rhodomonas_salina.1
MTCHCHLTRLDSRASPLSPPRTEDTPLSICVLLVSHPCALPPPHHHRSQTRALFPALRRSELARPRQSCLSPCRTARRSGRVSQNLSRCNFGLSKSAQRWG